MKNVGKTMTTPITKEQLTGERIADILEMATDAAKRYGSKWDSALVGGVNGNFHAITSDTIQAVVVQTNDDSRDASWLCDYLESVSPATMISILRELQERRKAAMDAEPYGYVHKAIYESMGSCGLSNDHDAHLHSLSHIAVYTAPPAPVVPEIDRKAIADRAYGKCCRIPGATFYNAVEFALDEVDACRAAMLQSEPVSNRDKLPGTQIKQVADLYSIAVPGGRSVTYSTDAAEASDCRVLGWAVQEYVELERYQEAVVGNSPVIPDGWIPVSERMPPNKPGSYEYIVFDSLNNKAHHDYWNVPDGSCDDFSPFWNHYGKYVTHWMPLPAAPQQEVM